MLNVEQYGYDLKVFFISMSPQIELKSEIKFSHTWNSVQLLLQALDHLSFYLIFFGVDRSHGDDGDDDNDDGDLCYPALPWSTHASQGLEMNCVAITLQYSCQETSCFQRSSCKRHENSWSGWDLWDKVSELWL